MLVAPPVVARRRAYRMQRSAALFVVVLLGARAASSTMFVPLSVEELTASSTAVVLGTVRNIQGVEDGQGGVMTLVDVAVDEVVGGEIGAPRIVLEEDGGVVHGHEEVVFGTPRFAIGETVLVFLTQRPNGAWRTNHLALGKFHIEIDAGGMPRARQHQDNGTTILGADGAAPADHPLGELLAAIENSAPRAPAAAALADRSPTHGVTHAFKFGPTGRFFEADEGLPVAFLIDRRGDSTLGLAASRQALAQAFATWTDVPTATLVLQDGGLTDDVSAPCPGANKILFDDPEGAIPDPVKCRGTLGVTAIGGPCTSSFETKVFNGRTFQRALRAKVTFANGWNGCEVWNPCNFAELATHEVGHAIGFAHSSDDPDEIDPTLQDATMYLRAHFDGRCSALRSDDVSGAGVLYPTSLPPTILTADPLFDGRAGAAYRLALHAIGGTGTFTWSLVSGGYPGLDLDASGVISGTPNFGGNGFLQVKATDTNGDSHTKVLSIHVSGPTPRRTRTPTITRTPTVTPTATVTPPDTVTPRPTSTPTATETLTATPSETPRATATETPTPTPPPTATDTAPPTATLTPSATPTATPACQGDCDGSGDVTIAEILTLVNRALDDGDPQPCPAGDANHDGVITVNDVVGAVNAVLLGCG